MGTASPSMYQSNCMCQPQKHFMDLDKILSGRLVLNNICDIPETVHERKDTEPCTTSCCPSVGISFSYLVINIRQPNNYWKFQKYDLMAANQTLKTSSNPYFVSSLNAVYPYSFRTHKAVKYVILFPAVSC